MKTFFAAIVCAAVVSGAVNAKVTNIADWEDNLGARTMPTKTSCAEACPGYEITTVVCPEGQTMVDCEAEGCNYYHKCQ